MSRQSLIFDQMVKCDQTLKCDIIPDLNAITDILIKTAINKIYRRIYGFIPFPKVLVLCEIKSVTSRTRRHVFKSWT